MADTEWRRRKRSENFENSFRIRLRVFRSNVVCVKRVFDTRLNYLRVPKKSKSIVYEIRLPADRYRLLSMLRAGIIILAIREIVTYRQWAGSADGFVACTRNGVTETSIGR